ncbi:MAG: GNAT family N-acetyltransferase [Acetobacteraceae bacterium]|nr:GNAT family N-acetyltransferase [Acetobacteraceae bacterium]MDW8397395.1 GNAT family N-acetyltransferase [Acetobacteraceae bacterium]
MTGARSLVTVRRAHAADAGGIAAVHAEVWRNAYAGILPAGYLARLSPARLAAGYRRSLSLREPGHAVFVAVGPDPEAGFRTIGFVSGGRARRPLRDGAAPQGEVETLYLLDDWREQGVGRRLMRAIAAHLAAIGCRSAFVWALSDNPSTHFYRRLAGRLAARERIAFAGAEVEQSAFLWSPIEALLAATAPAPRREIEG